MVTEVTPQNLPETPIALGVPHGDNRATQLDALDWAILHQLLTKPIVGGVSATTVSPKLRILAAYAENAAAWCVENGR